METTFLSMGHLQKGQKAVVREFHDLALSLRLMQLGFTPGTEFRVDGAAPLGCPIWISLDGDYHLTLRKSEAESIEIELR